MTTKRGTIKIQYFRCGFLDPEPQRFSSNQ
jgi:hypothetical protein